MNGGPLGLTRRKSAQRLMMSKIRKYVFTRSCRKFCVSNYNSVLYGCMCSDFINILLFIFLRNFCL